MHSTPNSPGQGGLPSQTLTLHASQRRQGIYCWKTPSLGHGRRRGERAQSLAGWCVPTTTAGLCNGAAIAPPRLLRQQPKPWLNLLFLPTPTLGREPPPSQPSWEGSTPSSTFCGKTSLCSPCLPDGSTSNHKTAIAKTRIWGVGNPKLK